MSKRIDKEKELKEMNESQASLVIALESIHTLLEESETKLSAARESLKGSRIDNKKHYKPGHTPRLSTSPQNLDMPADDENIDVPLLDDIVIPTLPQEPLPLFDGLEIKTENKTSLADATEISPARKQEFLNTLDTMQVEMDDYLNEMLVRCMASIELELKETLSKKFQELRNIIEK